MKDVSAFVSLIKIDLMDFRNCPWECSQPRKWAMNIIDHHTKYLSVHPLHAKSADEVTPALKKHRFTYEFPKKS